MMTGGNEFELEITDAFSLLFLFFLRIPLLLLNMGLKEIISNSSMLAKCERQ